MQRQIGADRQGAENQREETQLEPDRHRTPRKQAEACRKSFAAQSAGQMRDAIAEEGSGENDAT